MKKISWDETTRKKIVLEPVDEFEFDNSPPKTTTKRWLLLVWLFIFSLAYVGIFLVVFDYWSVYFGMPFITVFLWIMWLFLFPDKTPQKRGRTPLSIFEEQMYKPSKLKNSCKNFLNKIKNRPLLFVGGMIGWFAVVFVGCFFGNGICITGTEPFLVSTRFTRSFMPDLCPGPAPCHVYLTLPESTSDSIIVNFQTPGSLSSNSQPRIYYDESSHRNQSLLSTYNMMDTATTYFYKSQDIQRSIHWGVLSGLKQNTTYYFRVGYVRDKTKKVNDEDDALFSEEKSFLTAPDGGPFSFVTGGDVGISPLAEEMMSLSAQSDPRFVAIGGDIAYANGMETCYRSWDIFLNNYEKRVVSPNQGHLIPMILGVGNHEGESSLASLDHLPFFIKWFAQSRINQQPSKRLSYHVHTFSNSTVLLALDTMVSAAPNGQQLDWINQQFSNFASRFPNRIAMYHNPLYPSARAFSNSDSTQLRKFWGPIFDSYNLSIGFENHDHAYKRSKPIRNNQVDSTGTLYVEMEHLECQLDPPDRISGI